MDAFKSDIKDLKFFVENPHKYTYRVGPYIKTACGAFIYVNKKKTFNTKVIGLFLNHHKLLN